jgi:catechol 2,3-dioxygenase-like lactoylglutathione lyase family enzyme
MTPSPCYVGVIVRDLETSVAWYTKTLRCRVAESGTGWASLELDGGSRVELTAGDPDQPGVAFPSYGNERGPSVLPGYNVEEPEDLAEGLTVARRLPEWIVVVAPDRVRVVLTRRECEPGRGLVGFRWLTPEPGEQRAFLDQLGVPGTVEEAPSSDVVPVIRGPRAAEVEDPDGHVLAIVTG